MGYDDRMPFAGYKNHAECVKKNSGKEDPDAYCAEIERQAKKKEKSKLLKLLDLISR
jgi:hypothetical protein